MPPSRVDRTAALVLFFAVCAAYFNAFAGTWQFGDYAVIVRDPAVASLSGWLADQPGIRPLLKLTFALNNLVPEDWGARLYAFHVVNVLVHLCATLLVYAVLRRLTHDDDIVFRDQRLAAFIAALVFALHPAQTEAVTYLSGRATSLAAMFALLSVLLWLRGREYEDKFDLYVRSPFAFVLALLCKEYVAVLPLALLLVARLESGRLRWLRAAMRESAAHWVVALAALGALVALPRYRELVLASLDARDIGTQLFTQAHAIVYLAGQMVRFDRLNVDPALPVVAALDTTTILYALTIVATLALGAFALRRYPVLGFAILWFYVWILPGALLPRLEVANDRQLYLALIGPALGCARVLVRLMPRGVQWALMPVLAFGLVFATWQRNAVYGDEIAFWQDVTDKAPHNARAFGNLGQALAGACRGAEAERALQAAFALDPALTQTVMNLTLLRAGTLPGLGGQCAAQPDAQAAAAANASQAAAPADASQAAATTDAKPASTAPDAAGSTGNAPAPADANAVPGMPPSATDASAAPAANDASPASAGKGGAPAGTSPANESAAALPALPALPAQPASGTQATPPAATPPAPPARQ